MKRLAWPTGILLLALVEGRGFFGLQEPVGHNYFQRRVTSFQFIFIKQKIPFSVFVRVIKFMTDLHTQKPTH